MKVVCFGDSITVRTEGYDRPLLTIKLEAKLGNEWEVINAGVNGNNTFDARQRVERDVLIHQPDLVTVLFGANDAAFHKMVQLQDYKSNLTEIVTVLSPKKVLLLSPLPVDERLQQARTNAVLRQYAQTVREVSEETGSYYLDLFATMINLANLNDLVKGLRDDGLHIGELGYDHIASEISAKIREIVRAVNGV